MGTSIRGGGRRTISGKRFILQWTSFVFSPGTHIPGTNALIWKKFFEKECEKVKLARGLVKITKTGERENEE